MRFGSASKRFFALNRANDKCSRPARKIAACGFVNQQMGSARKRRNLPLLPCAKLQYRDTARDEQSRQFGNDRPIRGEAIDAAVKRLDRIMLAHLARQRSDFSARHIWRIGDDEIECRSKRRAPIAENEACSQPKTERFEICPRDLQGTRAEINANAVRLWKFQQHGRE
jgi:hypothetical protein